MQFMILQGKVFPFVLLGPCRIHIASFYNEPRRILARLSIKEFNSGNAGRLPVYVVSLYKVLLYLVTGTALSNTYASLQFFRST